ncbi:MAG: hypothetical protein GY862_19380, partial [Gammaproteobacteria bacterium]|nr:hypothetical protein [Gammaproteobacteria bacterium]
ADQAGYVAKLLGRYLKAYAQTELKKLAAEFMNLSGDTDAPIKAEIMREDVINVILAALREASRQRPVLLAVEDVQWADAGSLRLLHSLLEPSFQKSCKYLHTVLTVLPGQESVCPEYPHIGLLKLMPLSSEETEKLLDKLLDGKAVRPGIREQIAAYSDGVPLFAEQLALAWAKLSAADELENLLVPPLLYDLLFAPLDESGSAKKIARLGAVLGREFDYASLRAVWPGDEADLLAGLSKLTDSQVIYSRGQMPGTIYRFNCALTQVAAYQSLLKRQIDEVRATQ